MVSIKTFLRFLYHYPTTKNQNYQYTTHTKIITNILHIIEVVLGKNDFRLGTLPYEIYSALQPKYGIRSTPKYKIQLTLFREIKEAKYVI